MRNCINIKCNNQVFPYIVDYTKNENTNNVYDTTVNNDVCWSRSGDVIRLFTQNIDVYRDKNNWYDRGNLSSLSSEYIPDTIVTNNIKVYIPTHSISAYISGVKYVLTLNTWVNGVKIDLGSYVFGVNDTYAVECDCIKNGNNEYYECVDFDIIDPFYLMYGDNWIDFRHNVCSEPEHINTTGSCIYVSLFVIDASSDSYLINSECIGGYTFFNISDDYDFLNLYLNTSYDPLGFSFKLNMNSQYDNLMEYICETYNIDAQSINIQYNIVIKNNDSIIIGPTIDFESTQQCILWNSLAANDGLKTFFGDWNMFDEGWSMVGSLTIYDNTDNYEMLSIISNEIPITQELFAMYTNNGAEKIMDVEDMIFNTYNVVNKIENKIIQVERPNISKNNIMQPVFFRVKDTEMLTLHPAVTENICINLDNYKSKVERFVLQIDNNKYEQIGSNNYGVLFKVYANTISSTNGIYYVLNENHDLITSGKFSCVK